MTKLTKIAIVGLTHGNEITSYHLINALKHSKFFSYKPLEIDFIFANILAYNQGKRYIDEDLNRCFSKNKLAEKAITTEAKLAQKLAYKLTTQNYDCIIDLHTTTSNMKKSIIPNLNNDINTNKILSLTKSIDSSINILYSQSYEDNSPYITNLIPISFTIEIGSVPKCCLVHSIYEDMHDTLETLISAISIFNTNPDSTYKSYHAYQALKAVPFPKCKPGIRSMIHKNIQHQDYKILKPGELIFYNSDGTSISYEGEKQLYLNFINEESYYEKNIAFYLAKKILVNPNDLRS